LPPSFSATLASSMASSSLANSSMASSAANHPQSQSAPVATTTESNPVVGANNFDERIDDARIDNTRFDDTKIDTNVGAKVTSNPAPARIVSSNPNLNISLNILRLKAMPIVISAVKSDAKPDAKSDAKSVSNPDSNPGSNLNVKPIAKPAADPAPGTKPSSPAFPPVTIAALPTYATPPFIVFGKSSVAAPASRSAESASNSQPLSLQLTVNPASVPTPSPQLTAIPAGVPALSPPLSDASLLTTTSQTVAPSLKLTSPPSNDQPDRNATIAAAPAPPGAVTSSAEAVPVSNFSKAVDVVSAASEVAKAPVNFRVPSQAQPTSSEISHVAGQAVADPAPSFRINPNQPLAQPAQSSIPPGAASQTSTGVAAPISVTATSVLPTAVLSAPASLVSAIAAQSASPASPAATPAPTAPPADSALPAPIPTGATIAVLAPDPSSTARSQTVSPAPSPAAQA